ncbi:uncharacterized protein LOC133294333 [Gastrolobium bilobum]|uniref:uncharacterized protein LOC133294333 n=1 Tax=Gastrolobium bilobum TaxID=150636 RepID=UPI002AB22A23|nr:uncharacterized protein LOC133294333 [Gastrolobium bilobum]
MTRVQELSEEFHSFKQRVDTQFEELRAQSTMQATDTRNQISLLVHQMQQLQEVVIANHSPRRDPPHGNTSNLPLTHPDSTDNRSLLKGIRMEMSLFNGNYPNNWIFKAELFFTLQSIPEDTKVPLAGLKMDGMAASWFQWIFKSGTACSWGDFSSALRHRFGIPGFTNLKGALSKLTQTSSLRHFIQQFEALVNQTPELDDDLKNFFISGLQSELRGAVQLREPNSLHQAIQLAMAYDDHFGELKNSFQGTQRKFASRFNSVVDPTPVTTHSPTPMGVNQLLVSTTQRLALPALNHGKRFSHVDLQKRRDMGLCYTCDERWNSNHICKNKLMLLVGEESDQDPEIEEETIVWQADNSGGESRDAALHALNDGHHYRSLMFLTTLKGMEFSVLVDSGSTHNFIQKHLAIQLSLPMSHSHKIRVYLGNGEVMISDKKCLKVPLMIQGTCFVCDLWVLELADLNVILGMPWLEKLGKVTHDYIHKSMELFLEGQPKCLQGQRLGSVNGGDSDTPQSDWGICDVLQVETKLQVQDTIGSELLALKDSVPNEIWLVLVRFQYIFSLPCGLPPFRGMDHSIHLTDNASPINVKPYRYAHSQKSEIERQVTDLLNAGFIQHSQSPFSSPVLLVRKQDNS